MLKRRATSKRQEILSRTIRVDSVHLSLSRRTEKPRGAAPYPENHCWIELHGEADEPVREIQRFVVSLYLEQQRELTAAAPSTVGGIIQVRPQVHAVVKLDSAFFDRTWTLAASEQLRFCWLAFTRPVRRFAEIVNVSFSNEIEE